MRTHELVRKICNQDTSNLRWKSPSCIISCLLTETRENHFPHKKIPRVKNSSEGQRAGLWEMPIPTATSGSLGMATTGADF